MNEVTGHCRVGGGFYSGRAEPQTIPAALEIIHEVSHSLGCRMTTYAFRALAYFWHSVSKQHAYKKKEKWGWARHILHAAVHARSWNYAGIPQPSQAVGRQSFSETLLYSACTVTRRSSTASIQGRLAGSAHSGVIIFKSKAAGKLSVRMNKRRILSEKPVIQGYRRCQ